MVSQAGAWRNNQDTFGHIAMQTNFSGSETSPRHRARNQTAIAALHAERLGILNELGKLSANYEDDELDALLDQLEAVMDEMSHRKPRNWREAAILLSAAEYHADLLNCIYDTEEAREKARQSRVEKLERILAALIAIFPPLELTVAA